MADQDRRRFELALHVPGRGNEIGDVGRECRAGEVALALAQASEIEAQHGDPLLSQRPADVDQRLQVFRASKAVREKGVGDDVAIRR